MKDALNGSLNTNDLLNVSGERFSIYALDLFRFQYAHNELYRRYCDIIGLSVTDVTTLTQIPFLPISFFKTHEVLTLPATAGACSLVFESSGTTGSVNSRHMVFDPEVYRISLLNGFQKFYGPPSDYVILALLPSYLERANASLVYMAKTLMEAGAHADSGFYINEWDKLSRTIQKHQGHRKVLLLGVTFALLDFAEAHPAVLKDVIVMETGGMKGRRTEMTRAEVHMQLSDLLGIPIIHSEYGMTELLSQAYATGNGIFRPTATMLPLVRDINDPLDVKPAGSGVLNIVDLANVYSCAFIATEDMGRIHTDGSFEVLGRIDHSALRGCSLMAV